MTEAVVGLVTILEGVAEYGEGMPVRVVVYRSVSCVETTDENGLNTACIDAQQLYHALRELFEAKDQ